MKVFLWQEKQFFNINKKEEIDDNTYLITDREEEGIKESLDGEGYLWIKDGIREIGFSGKKPSEIHVWDSDNKQWIIEDTLKQEKLTRERSEVWEKIKAMRLQKCYSGVYIDSVDKWFHTDGVAVNTYAQIGLMIALNNFNETDWKTMDGSFVHMTPELFKQIQTAMFKNTQLNFAVAEKHMALVKLSENPLEYDYSTYWTNGKTNPPPMESIEFIYPSVLLQQGLNNGGSDAVNAVVESSGSTAHD